MNNDMERFERIIEKIDSIVKEIDGFIEEGAISEEQAYNNFECIHEGALPIFTWIEDFYRETRLTREKLENYIKETTVK